MICDNSCAVGITNKTMKHRRSKVIAMRYHWVRDRAAQGHFAVEWQPGKGNLADCFTKAYTGKATNAIRDTYVHSPPLPYIRDNARSRRISRAQAAEGATSSRGCVGREDYLSSTKTASPDDLQKTGG